MAAVLSTHSVCRSSAYNCELKFLFKKRFPSTRKHPPLYIFTALVWDVTSVFEQTSPP